MNRDQTIELTAQDKERLGQLRQMKRLALTGLLGCFAIYLTARWGMEHFPAQTAWIAFIAAAAEAATVGGVADWYAVVVLFRHPLGVKIPHTAIIPQNQEKIAENIGTFIETNFMQPHLVRERLEKLDFAAYAADYIGDRRRADALSRLALKMVPEVLAAIENSGFKSFAAKQMTNQINKVQLAPVAANLVDGFIQDRRMNRLFDEILQALDRLLHDEVTLEILKKRVAEELPTVLYIVQAESTIINRIVKSGSILLQEVKDDPNHPLRDEMRELFADYVERLKSSKKFARRVEWLKGEIIERPEIANLADGIWHQLEGYVAEDAARAKPVLAHELGGMLVSLSERVKKDEKLRHDINEGMVRALVMLVDARKSDVSSFITDQVRSWDFKRLVTLIEANVGRDLQFIRFNGMAIGAVVGVVLHVLDISLFG
ncbi:MAG: DUF445 family protein [Pseudomonadota bacterium]